MGLASVAEYGLAESEELREGKYIQIIGRTCSGLTGADMS